ncbi:MAG: hypothetical protein UV60_C0008G0001 [Parcubacteria group bacterium GW2011_GWA2_43_11]|nr:MAG: hypothetical protein UU89_C0021G0010 [Parcubacteria group bacterium GW2011_GWC2_42_11]KKS85379.1 MAG: hypothetical protein UV60_C0008G0001 [Parcubacteria group bacterium GW2011_GWA2_43_11]
MEGSECEDLFTKKEPEQKQEQDTRDVLYEQEAQQHWLGGTTASGKLWPNP